MIFYKTSLTAQNIIIWLHLRILAEEMKDTIRAARWPRPFGDAEFDRTEEGELLAYHLETCGYTYVLPRQISTWNNTTLRVRLSVEFLDLN